MRSSKPVIAMIVAICVVLCGLLYLPALLCESTKNYGYCGFEIGAADGKPPVAVFVMFGGPGKRQTIVIDSNRDGIVDAKFRIFMSDGKTYCDIDSDLDGVVDQSKLVETDGGVPRLTNREPPVSRKASAIAGLRAFVD